MAEARDYLVRQLETAWHLTSFHLDGLTTEECLWRPAREDRTCTGSPMEGGAPIGLTGKLTTSARRASGGSSLLVLPHPFWALAFALLGSAILGTLGLVAGIWAEKFDQLAAFQNFLITPLTFLSGVFYSIHSLPPFWQSLSHANPFFYMIDGFRYGFFGLVRRAAGAEPRDRRGMRAPAVARSR